MKYFAKIFITSIITSFFVFFFAIIGAVCFGIATQCEHTEIGTKFSFQFENSTAASNYETYCIDCYQQFSTARFYGTPDDLSYLDIVGEHSDSGKVIAGQYHTVTATVTFPDHDFDKTRLNCKVEDSGTTVYFSVEFKEEFEESVSCIEKGDTIIFYGQFYEEGCGFKDCVLLS